mgnify:CR=1 FL=1
MKSPELQEMEQEDLDREPSLDKMMDLSDPKVLRGLGKLARLAREHSTKAGSKPGDGSPPQT